MKKHKQKKTSGFKVLLADPPWQYDDSGALAGTKDIYSGMSMDDMYGMGDWIKSLVQDDSWLFMWFVNAFGEEAHLLAKSWGFVPKTIMTWFKCKPQQRTMFGFVEQAQPRTTTGHYVLNATEHILICTRGRVRPTNRGVQGWFFAPVGRHSLKPDKSYRIIEEITEGQTPRGEIFARRVYGDWWGWGNQYPDKRTLIKCPHGKVWPTSEDKP